MFADNGDDDDDDEVDALPRGQREFRVPSRSIQVGKKQRCQMPHLSILEQFTDFESYGEEPGEGRLHPNGKHQMRKFDPKQRRATSCFTAV